jgi:hypothetical protein
MESFITFTRQTYTALTVWVGLRVLDCFLYWENIERLGSMTTHNQTPPLVNATLRYYGGPLDGLLALAASVPIYGDRKRVLLNARYDSEYVFSPPLAGVRTEPGMVFVRYVLRDDCGDQTAPMSPPNSTKPFIA